MAQKLEILGFRLRITPKEKEVLLLQIIFIIYYFYSSFFSAQCVVLCSSVYLFTVLFFIIFCVLLPATLTALLLFCTFEQIVSFRQVAVLMISCREDSLKREDRRCGTKGRIATVSMSAALCDVHVGWCRSLSLSATVTLTLEPHVL